MPDLSPCVAIELFHKSISDNVSNRYTIVLLMLKSKCKHLVRARGGKLFHLANNKAVSWIVHLKQTTDLFWSYCFISLLVIFSPTYAPNGMAVLKNTPLAWYFIVSWKHRLEIISAGSRTPIKCGQLHDPLERLKLFEINLACCKGNWRCLHSSRPFMIRSDHFQN